MFQVYDLQEWLREKVIIYLSPHFDDLAYSNGGLIAKGLRFESFTVVNVFTTSLWAPNIRNSDIETISAIRAEEDKKYRERYRIDSLNLGFGDSSCRGYDELEELQSDWKQDAIFVQVQATMRRFFQRSKCDIIFCPLALGDHIDHVMLFQLAQQFGHSVCKIFYEDIPYCANLRIDEIENVAQKRLGTAYPVNVDITNWSLHKMEDMRIYASQTREEDLVAAYTHAQRCGFGGFSFCERLWIPCVDLPGFIKGKAQ